MQDNSLQHTYSTLMLIYTPFEQFLSLLATYSLILSNIRISTHIYIYSPHTLSNSKKEKKEEEGETKRKTNKEKEKKE